MILNRVSSRGKKLGEVMPRIQVGRLYAHSRMTFLIIASPNLADAMKVMGFVQRFGIGIQTARAEMKKKGNPDIEFHVEPVTVLATVRILP